MHNLNAFEDYLEKSLRILEEAVELLSNSDHSHIRKQPIVASRSPSSNYVYISRQGSGGSIFSVKFRYRKDGEDAENEYSEYPGGFKAISETDLVNYTGNESYLTVSVEIIIDPSFSSVNTEGVYSAVSLYAEIFVNSIELLYTRKARSINHKDL